LEKGGKQKKEEMEKNPSSNKKEIEENNLQSLKKQQGKEEGEKSAN
jgi:hypothetical protein